jgi:thioesterase domain-containing protein
LIAERGVADTDDKAQAGDTNTPKAPARRFTHLVPMHVGEGGAKTPFFLVAGMFGNVLNLRHLAHLVGNDRPFYGLQARGLLGDEPPHRTIEAAAKDYIAEMRQVQPNGPYMVGGFSGGGITAYEIAQQLRAAGEDVSDVIMLDTPLPVRPYIDRADNIRVKLTDLKRGGPQFVLDWTKRRVNRLLNKGSTDAATVDEGAQFHNAAIQEAFLESVGNYDVKPWDGPLALFRPPLVPKWMVGDRLISEYRNYLYHDNDWTQFAPDISVFEVPGDHDSMVLEPNVRVLASRLKRRLAQAEAQSIIPINFKEAAE